MGISKPISLDGQTVNVDLTGINSKLDTLQNNITSIKTKNYKKYYVSGNVPKVTNPNSKVEWKTITLEKALMIKYIVFSFTSSTKIELYIDGVLICTGSAEQNYIITLNPQSSTTGDKILFTTSTDKSKIITLDLYAKNTIKIKTGVTAEGVSGEVFISGIEE